MVVTGAGLFQKNKVSAWIDGSFIYSNIEPWVNIMRTFSKG
jgi:hypothetical protein